MNDLATPGFGPSPDNGTKDKLGKPAPASRHYLVASVLALGVILLVLLQWGMGRWSFLPVLIGLLGATLRWRMTGPSRSPLERRIGQWASPLLPLILLAGLLLAREALELGPLPIATRGLDPSAWLLSAAVLAFCIFQYRIQAMTVSIFPESGPPRDRPADRPCRNPRLVSSFEIGWALLALPIWAFLAQVCWRLVPAGVAPYQLAPRIWRGVMLAWVLASSVLAVSTLLGYAGLRRLRQREARLFLQDAFWQETALEQRRLSRWLAWARLRRRRKEKA